MIKVLKLIIPKTIKFVNNIFQNDVVLSSIQDGKSVVFFFRKSKLNNTELVEDMEKIRENNKKDGFNE